MGCRIVTSSPSVYGRSAVIREVADPPPDEVMVTRFGGPILEKVMAKLPGAGGTSGPITPVQGKPVAWLMRSSVAVSEMPGVRSVAVMISRALARRYVTAVMATVSLTGFTITVTVAEPVSPEPPLFPVTVNKNDCGAESVGTLGAVKVCTEPSTDPETRVIPAGAVQVNVTGPPAGSMAAALRVTWAPLATLFAGEDVAVTAGGVVGGAVAIGTSKFAVAAFVVLFPPTVSWKVKVVGAATTGATNVVVGWFGFVIVTNGSPGFTI